MESLVNDYIEKVKSFRKREISYTALTEHTKDFYPKLRALLEQAGLKVQFFDYDTQGFIILPEGTHPLARFAKGLAKHKMQVVVAPSLWPSALGQFAGTKVLIDLETLLSGKASFVMQHELRHAIDHIRTKKLEYPFERLFSTNFNAWQVKGGKVPGLSHAAYNEAYSLDEILAHRQSGTMTVRNLQREIKSGEVTEKTLKTLRGHGERLVDFIRGWKNSEAAVLERLRVGAFEWNSSFEKLEEFPEVSLRIKEPGMFQKWRMNDVPPDVTGLAYGFTLTKEEYALLKNKKTGQEFFENRIKAIGAELNALEREARAFHEATKNFDGKDATEVERTLRAFARKLAERRRAINPPK